MATKKRFETISGIELKELYAPTPPGGEYLTQLGYPGEFPYTRGIQKTMYRGKAWTMRQYAGFGSARSTNERYKYLLSEGTTGLSVAFDLPTQMGRDSDDPLAKGEVGKVGVAIDTIQDMESLFADIPLEEITVSMTINATAHILLGLYLVLAKRRGVPFGSLGGTIQNDILKEYIARGTYIYPPRPALRIVTDIFAYCASEVPKWNTISISGYHIREAGSDAIQELAFTFGDAITYVEEAVKRGMDVDTFAPRIAFFFNCHNQFLEEVAKFRAARRIWAKIMKERFGARNPRSLVCRFHTQTAGSSLTAQQPEVNLVRTTIQALAAVMGGTQSLHTNSYDEALGLPTEKSALLALRTQQIIAEESGVSDVVDPLGGSYVIESLTDSIEAGVFKYLEKIQALGGMIKAIEQEYPQKEIEDSAYRYQRGVESGELKVVGVNCYTAKEEAPQNVMKVDAAVEQEQLERLSAFKKSRSETLVKQLKQQIHDCAVSDSNLMPVVVETLDQGLSLGEISSELRNVFGEQR